MLPGLRLGDCIVERLVGERPIARLRGVDMRELLVPGVFEVTPRIFPDSRGTFLEYYRFEPLEARLGTAPQWQQGSMSVSAKGVVRGIHFAPEEYGQAKYVTVPRGAVRDVVVDLRPGSPTFGQWDAVLLDGVDRRALYIAPGVGHLFEALEDDTIVAYLLTKVYAPEIEQGVNPFDESIGIRFEGDPSTLIVSEKDRAAPSLEAIARLGASSTENLGE
jgi:dTDP-4-dehydrorhamnose 3,5-epimerase